MKIAERNYIIDLLRFLAALWVTLFHFNEPYLYVDNWYRNFSKLGHLGVPVFFVISGYCIMLTASRSKNSLDFITRRFFRIFPTYWMSLLIVIAVIIIQKAATGFNSITKLPEDIKGVVATVTLLTDPVTNIKTINWVYWSLSFEVFFYLVIAISLAFENYFRLLFLLFISVLSFAMNDTAGSPLFFLQHWPAFALGLSLYFIINKVNVTSTIIAVLLLLFNVLILFERFGFHGHQDYLVTALISTFLIVAGNYYPMKPNFFTKLGDYSYSVYLVHVPIGVYLFGLFKTEYVQEKILLNILFDLIVYAIISLTAYLIFRLIEKPSIKLGTKFSKRLFERPGSVVPTSTTVIPFR